MNSLWLFSGFLLFLLPGALVSLLLKSKAKAISSLVISGNLLFQCCFWLNCLGLRISLSNILIIWLPVTILFLFLAREELKQIDFSSSLKWKVPSYYCLLLIPVLIAFSLFAARSILQAPLPGDVTFRWNFLAHKILQYGHFNFYPPVTPQDYDIYFYTDAIPPMVAFINFWMLAIANEDFFGVQLFIILQYALCLLVCFQITRQFTHNKLAPYFATACLAATPLFFFALYLGQESGLLTLSLAGVVLFASRKGNVKAAILLAFTAALGALSREYGLSFLFIGLLITFLKKWQPKHQGLLGTVFILLVAPWYIRTWIITGNPFYSIGVVGLFPVNPVHNGIMHYYNSQLGFSSPFLSTIIKQTLKNLIVYGYLVVLLSIPAFCFSKRWRKMLLPGIILIILLWGYSVGYTSGGTFLSLRVLAPALCLLATGSGIFLARKEKFNKIAVVIVLIICLLGCWMQITIPYPVWKSTIAQYGNIGFKSPYFEENQIFAFDKLLPKGSRVISNNARYHATLSHAPEKNISLIPVWSPEVQHLAVLDLSFDEGVQSLKDKGIHYIIFSRKSLNEKYLKQFPFYGQLGKKAIPIAWNKQNILYKLP